MNEDLKNLYRTVGITAPMPDDAVSFGALGAQAQGDDSADLPPLDASGLDQLEEELNLHPRKTVSRVRQMWDPKMTEQRLREHIATARRALNAPDEMVAEIETAALSFALNALPDGFEFPGMDINDIGIDPDDRKFENDDLVGVLGWIFGAGPFVLGRPDKKNFRFHNQPRFTSNFVYPLEEPAQGAPLEIALFSDFGVGRYYSKYIAKQLRTRRFPYAIHLGDVYFAGRRSEFAEYFEPLIDPILADTSVFALNSNHEMFSGGVPYFDYITKRATLQPGKQKQEGSYFCLRSEKFQIIGIDTAFFGQGRYKETVLVDWLRDRLREGRQAGRVNILLSADHPYNYGEKKLAKLLDKDLKALALDERLVDLWFWGNTHYCALYGDKPAASGEIPILPFVGSCIGHGGYPYDIVRKGKFEPAPIVFLEENARFPQATNLRQDRGNNGYCVLQLNADGSLGLKYVDWMSNLRFEAALTRGPAGQPLRITPVGI
ncbi:MAG: metallophosphoesterase [Acidobacteriota bacterium]